MSSQKPYSSGKRAPTGTFRSATFRPMVPDVPPVQAAMSRAGALGSLMARLKASQACLSVVKALLPAGMGEQVRAGSLDEEGWTLLVSTPALSAKLRQMQPELLAALRQQGVRITEIRIKVQRA